MSLGQSGYVPRTSPDLSLGQSRGRPKGNRTKKFMFVCLFLARRTKGLRQMCSTARCTFPSVFFVNCYTAAVQLDSKLLAKVQMSWPYTTTFEYLSASVFCVVGVVPCAFHLTRGTDAQNLEIFIQCFKTVEKQKVATAQFLRNPPPVLCTPFKGNPNIGPKMTIFVFSRCI